jgi:hypothetical protein
MPWTCPYCGGTYGYPFQDNQLQGMLCLHPDCGRFVVSDPDHDDLSDWDATDF